MMISQSLAGEWRFRQVGAAEWMPAQVPGGVHTDLLSAGRIPDPFVGDNENRVQWVAESDWEYRRTFVPERALLGAERIYLVCDGLDTLAEITLNGRPLGQTENMFRTYRWEIGSSLQEGENELAVTFRAPASYVRRKQAQRPMQNVTQGIPGAPHLRKAPCQFGWDWGPILPPIGIWKGIHLEGYSIAWLENIHWRQHHQEGRVSITADLSLGRWQEGQLSAQATIITPDDEAVAQQVEIDGKQASIEIPIDRPRLWWPNGYGDQPLYQVETRLLDGERILDLRRHQLGLRTLELRQEEDQFGRSFTFVVNGVPIFAKGSNWIPADSFPTRLSDERLEHLLRSAAASHQNMLRVWGGGFYEEERFYDLCDRLGILVWQDFVFSCAIYPLDEAAFLENLRAEVVQNIQRLRHRASLALWCGNNEMEWGWEEWGWAEVDPVLMALAEQAADRFPQIKALLEMAPRNRPLPDWEKLRDAYDLFFHSTLPEWVTAEDPDTAYWPSSPSSDTPFHNVNGEEKGDAHYWEVWHGRKPFTAYRDRFPRFMSEFGFQSLPPLQTIRHYADKAEWNLTSYVMEHHQRSAGGNTLMISQMGDLFRMPKDFPSLVYLSMVLQAEGIRYGVEHWRRNMHRVSGTLYWQLNDCWPVASWSSLDYFGRWKALHYAAQRFYRPILLSIMDEPPRMGIYLCNDQMQAWKGTLRWSLERLDGKILRSDEEKVSVAAGTASHLSTLDFARDLQEERERDTLLVCELMENEQRMALVVTPFVPSKHLKLCSPAISVQLSQQDGMLAFELEAESLARFVELELEGADVVLSDNYFDLPAGHRVTVTCPLPEGWTRDQAETRIRVRSLYDSYA
jgi:beta-mannosidase